MGTSERRYLCRLSLLSRDRKKKTPRGSPQGLGGVASYRADEAGHVRKMSGRRGTGAASTVEFPVAATTV